MIYLDSSALLKLLFQEDESDALETWLSTHTDVAKVSSMLAKVEVLRASRRLDPAVLPTAQRLMSQLDLVPLAADVVDRACQLPDDALHSLDALHLASALVPGPDLLAFVVYDRRLAAAARGAGLPVVHPGR